FFEQSEEHYGRYWPLRYRDTSDRERSDLLRRFGVRAFPALAYPHKPGMAGFLNDWTFDLAARTPDCVPSLTFFPEPGAGGYVRSALDRGARIAKAHLQVGGYDPNDPLLDPVWGALAEAGTPAVVHCGNGPRRGAHTGVGPMEAVLRRFPGLVLVVAHAGLPRVRRAGRPVAAGSPGHHDGRHRVHRADGADAGRLPVPAGRPGRPGG